MKKLLIAASVLAVGITAAPLASAQANVDNTRDCDTVAIIKCGTMTKQELETKYRQNEYGDLRAVFQEFEIDEVEMHGFKDGIVWRDGRVTVDGKTVATDAQTAGRWNNPKADMKKIPGTQRAYVMDTKHMVTEGQTAMVKMVDDTFEFAVIKSCGNPVAAKPVIPQQPKKEEPKVVTKPTPVKPAVKEEQKVVVEEEVVVVEEQPEVVASTGPAEFASGGLGISSLTAAGYYWLRSRRKLNGDS